MQYMKNTTNRVLRSVIVPSRSGIVAAIVLLVTILLSAEANSRVADTNEQDTAAGLNQLAWLAGGWETSEGPRYVEEHWTRPSGRTMIGMGRTVAGDQTVSFEYLRIEGRADGIYYVAQPQGRPPVDFRLARLTASEAVFDNPGHSDHLQHIIYRRESDDSIVARIEGASNGKSFAQDFRYRRIASVRQ